MKSFQRITANTILFLNVLILFLFFFHERVSFPAWLQSIGRMHPLMVHLPIGMLALVLVLILFRKQFEEPALNNLIRFALYLAALAAAFTAFMGLVLAGEGGYNNDLLDAHMISGIGLSFLSWGLIVVFQFPEKKKLFLGSMVFTFVCLVVTGHLGASITHGENFVLQPLLNASKVAVITDSSSLYEAAIYPILERKCTTCHNDKKAKGELIMTSLDRLMAGGENGLAIVKGDPEKSLMMKRVHLPEENDDHMPPAGKPQLTAAEINLLHHWIEGGANTTTAWTRFSISDSIRLIAEPLIRATQKPAQTSQQYPFEFASSTTIENLNTPFLTVAQLAANEPALKADFFLKQAFDANKLNELTAVKKQMVALNLSNMPVTDADCKLIAQFDNLEHLNLNNSGISGKDFSFLANLKKLTSLSVTGTPVDQATAKKLGNITSLREVYLWNTSVTTEEVVELQEMFPEIRWNSGYIPAPGEILRLTPPILINENTVVEVNEPIRLKHNLPGTILRYTLDGSDPDSTTSMIYTKPIPINGFVKLKARACKDQWYCSGTIQQYLFKKGITPTTAVLTSEPDKDYKGEGITTVINSKKGTADNFRDISWLGFRDRPFAALFSFTKSRPPVASVTISYAHNISSFLMPPYSIELYGGNDEKNLQLIERVAPTQPRQMEGTRVEVISIPLKTSARDLKYYKLIINPVPKLPAWHSGKGQKGWIFLDEIFFQ
jgi:hypothetical protein